MGYSLSKSMFLRGLQCHKALWLYRYRAELIPEPDDVMLQRFADGKEAGNLAKELFPGGVEIPYESNANNMVQKTLELIEAGIDTIYEASFLYDDVFVRADILHKTPKGWELYEVKSSTDVKDVHIDDVAIQCYVLGGSGIDVTKASLVHINSDYVRRGEIDVKEIFLIKDVTAQVQERIKTIRQELEAMRRVLSAHRREPSIDIGPYCNVPYECPFKHYCWAHIPETSVFSINRLKGTRKFGLYYEGIIDLKDLPADYPLSPGQRIQIEAELKDIEFVNEVGIKGFLSSLHYPLCFLDFETFRRAIPPFDATSPYQQIPFLFSVHRIDSPEGELMHYYFFAEPGIDQRMELASALLEAIPEDACTVVYNAAFEKGILKDLADRYPECRERLMSIHENIVDLMAPFKNKHYYVKEMKGSYSLKAVVPALLPELSYDKLPISNGDQASVEYLKLPLIEDPALSEKIKQDLKKYCEFDTFVMVKLVERLMEL